MFEHKRRPLVSRAEYLRRQWRHLMLAGALVGVAMTIGTVGYHAIEGLGWVDSIYMASNILTGMGPTTNLASDAGKLFGSAFAMFSGVVFLTAASVLLAPAVHRLLHSLHMEFEEADRRSEPTPPAKHRKK